MLIYYYNLSQDYIDKKIIIFHIMSLTPNLHSRTNPKSKDTSIEFT